MPFGATPSGRYMPTPGGRITPTRDTEEVRDGARRLLRAGGHEIALFCVGERVHAIADNCPHQGASLVSGKLEGGAVSCRAHGLRFDLTTGCMRGAPGFGVRVYPIRIHDGQVQIDLAQPPSTQESSFACSL